MTTVKNLRQIYTNYYATLTDSEDVNEMDTVYGGILRRKANTFMKRLWEEEEMIMQTKYAHLFQDTKGDIYRRPRR
jgi:hypothetical protein